MSTIDRETFSYWVTRPQDVSQADLTRLETAARDFPYCQITYALMARAASQKSPYALSEVVSRAAVYALNRSALRRMVENEFEWSESLLGRFSDLPYGRSESRDKATPYGLEKPISLIRFEDRFNPTTELAAEKDPREAAFLEPLPVDDTVASEKVIEEELTYKRLKVTPIPPIELLPSAEPRDNSRRQQQELIEKFIQNDPRIGPIRLNLEDKSDPEDLTARSQATTLDGLATESLAKILVRQGKNEKAIEVYRKLVLKNPEKKDYFAEKIKELMTKK
ncbi:hypothetical protein [Telluribacter sp.]|jgi:tetratricopeptide (TPR) repeat protein|uniref:hypothetical protein n=1 Tax=Telluribacter sp. TaxID=1978767 RepID=UPI002E0EE9A2|nr:hypothetical protein [Telluribacter sp.]